MEEEKRTCKTEYPKAAEPDEALYELLLLRSVERDCR